MSPPRNRKIVQRPDHCEGISWVGRRSDEPSNYHLYVRFLYTQGAVPQVSSAKIVIVGSTILRIPYTDLESPCISRQLRFVINSE